MVITSAKRLTSVLSWPDASAATICPLTGRARSRLMTIPARTLFWRWTGRISQSFSALDLLAKWDDLTGKYDCTMAQLVIALTARMIPGLHVLCGARTPQQVMDNAGALNIKLDGADAVRMKWDVDAIS